MRELSTCDFCGEAAAGVYEVVPGDIPGVDARRMVLCDGCRDTLSDIVDPLLAAGRSGSGDAEAATTPTGEADTTEVTSTSSATETAADPGEGTDEADSTSVQPSEETAEAGEASASAASADDDTDDSAADGVTIESTDEDESDAASADPRSEEDAASEDETVADEGPQYESDPVERPPAYGKVVRLVENRDSGIGRRDLEELATGAYGLSAHEVDEAIEFALQHGTFEEADGNLRTVPVQ